MPRKRSCAGCLIKSVLVVLLLIAAAVYALWIFPFWGMPFNGSRHGRVPLTPPWALECWLWEDDVNTAEAVEELLAGYAEHDFPVRTILIDSPWSTRYNDYIVDESRYPNPEQFFTGLQDRGYRVVLWTTSMVDSSSKDTAILDSRDWFDEAKSKGYLTGDGHEIRWWKGRGGFIDYTNPEAMNWWRGLQQQVFDWGIDGWKLDGTGTLFRSSLGNFPFPYMKTHGGWMSTRGYMDHYYRDEYQHGLTQNPEFVTLSRSLDRLGLLDEDVVNSDFKIWLDGMAHPEGFAPLDASPVNWVGDQDHNWTIHEQGIEEALTDILRSARLGYNVIGSDVAGYSGGEIPANLYIRWAQFSTFCGLFLNGGHGERAMWKRSPEELEIVRTFSWLHTELVPYIYSHVVAAHKGGPVLMRPLDAKYHYLFGDAFLVAPIYEDSLSRNVTLPEGRWHYFFDDKEVITGPTNLNRDFPLHEFPVYVREGAIIPLDVKRDYTGFGNKDSEGWLTVLIYPGPDSSFDVVHPDGSGTLSVSTRSDDSFNVRLAGSVKKHIALVHCEEPPASVEIIGTNLDKAVDWSFDADWRKLRIQADTTESVEYRIALKSTENP